MNNNMLFVGLNHRINDPRLCYREIQVIQNEIDDIQIYFLEKKYSSNDVKFTIHREKKIFSNNIIHHIIFLFPPPKKNKLVGFLQEKLYNYPQFLYHAIKECKKLNFKIIQASDAREIFLTLILSKFCSAKIIYDSHEDYYRQIIDYREGKLIKYLFAAKIHLFEILLIRFFDSVFCTDEFLLKKYKKKIFGIKNVYLLRNFPNLIINNKKANIKNKLILKLVYIGGINKFRGVIECANYVHRFNEEHSDKKLSFDVYSPESPIIDDLRNNGLICYKSWIDYLDLMYTLLEYDVGICLWLPIKKFKRNLPLKNFDYMSVGLPIITSNFGYLKHYIFISNAGICIDPYSYDQFKEAILIMFDFEKRNEFGQNGLEWVQKYGLFNIEAKSYIDVINLYLFRNKRLCLQRVP